jgi:hypothetical protein
VAAQAARACPTAQLALLYTRPRTARPRRAGCRHPPACTRSAPPPCSFAMGGGGHPGIEGGGHIFSGNVDVGCLGPMFVAMIIFCWFLDLGFSTIEEKVPRACGRPAAPTERRRRTDPPLLRPNHCLLRRPPQLENSPANLTMLHKVYKELMILGFIQFFFILSKDFGITHPTKSYTHCFDFSLLVVTFTVFLYVSNTVSGNARAAATDAGLSSRVQH